MTAAEMLEELLDELDSCLDAAEGMQVHPLFDLVAAAVDGWRGQYEKAKLLGLLDEKP